MKWLKQNANGVFLCLFEMLVGILLLIDPIGFTSGIIIAAGIVLLAVGLVSIVKYFKTNAQEAAAGQMLLKGLISLIVGGFCVFRSQWFIVTFPILTVIYGIFTLVTGLGKVQLTVDLIRRKKKEVVSCRHQCRCFHHMRCCDHPQSLYLHRCSVDVYRHQPDC